MKLFKKANLTKAKVPNLPGIYKFFDKNRRLIYVGTSQILRHRIQSYLQKDDFNEHPTKKRLRKAIMYFDFKVMSIEKARQSEKKIKRTCKFNFK